MQPPNSPFALPTCCLTPPPIHSSWCGPPIAPPCHMGNRPSQGNAPAGKRPLPSGFFAPPPIVALLFLPTPGECQPAGPWPDR
ncbi:MAG: hypothetical protein INR71_09930 [Terriglobus roseus]|nr:hypothetical protein [Terriglobus roseus]